MADHYVERTERDSGSSAGMIVGIVVVLLVAVMALFFVFGTNRGAAPAVTPPGQTNVNVPSQQQPSGGPNIQVPRQIDVNVNQAPQQQPPAQQAPAGGQP